MRRHGIFQFIVLVVSFLSSAGVLFAQRTPKILVVNGRTASAAVVQIGGRSYVEINALAQATNGTLSYQQDRVLLTIPAAEAGAESVQTADRLSKDFAAAAVSALAQIREWQSVVVTVMGFGVLLEGPWYQDYHDRADSGMKLATVAVSTNSDQKAFLLLQNEFTNVEQWSGTLVANRRALNATKTMAPNAIQDDPAMLKITDCAKLLSPMLVSGIFRDIPSCH
jgi:hypothetical protein